MLVWDTRIDTASDANAANRADMLALIEGFRGLEQKVRDASNARRDLFEERRQLLPRDRVARM